MCELADVMMSTLLAFATFMDIKTKEISVYLLVIITEVAVFSAFIRGETWMSILGGAGIGVLFFIFSKCTREQIGYGDSWLILSLGIHAGVTKLIWILFAASFGAAMFSLIFCMIHKWNRRYSIPFIPFLAAAFIGVIFI